MRLVSILKQTASILHVSEEELESRRKEWKQPKPNYTRGALAKYASLVGSAAQGAVTRPTLAKIIHHRI